MEEFFDSLITREVKLVEFGFVETSFFSEEAIFNKLCKLIQLQPSIQKLYLFSNNFTAKQAQMIIESLVVNTNLRYLDIEGKILIYLFSKTSAELTVDVTNSLCKYLQHSQIQNLHLPNDISPECVQIFNKELLSCPMLAEIDPLAKFSAGPLMSLLEKNLELKGEKVVFCNEEKRPFQAQIDDIHIFGDWDLIPKNIVQIILNFLPLKSILSLSLS